MEGDRLFLESQSRPRVPSVVSVQYRDSLFVGETLRSIPTGKGWRSEIRVEQTLPESQSLLNLGRSLLAENAHQFRPDSLSAIPIAETLKVESRKEILTGTRFDHIAH